MKNRMNYEEFEEAMRMYDFINPVVSYEGEIFLSSKESYTQSYYDKEKDILYLNANQDKYGRNMYMELLKHTFYNGLREDLLDDNFFCTPLFYPALKIRLCQNRKGRELCYSYQDAILNLSSLTRASLPYVEDEVDPLLARIEHLRKILIKQRNDFLSISREGKNSPYYEEYMKGRENINVNKTIEKYNLIIPYIRLIKNILLDVKNGKRSLVIDSKRLEECFSFDSLLMIISKCILANQAISDKAGNSFVIPAVAQIEQYVFWIKTYGVKGYNPTIRYYNEELQKVVRYSFLELESDLKKLFRIHSEYSSVRFDMSGMEKLDVVRDVDGIGQLTRVLSEQSKQALKVGWEILPQGKREEALPERYHTEEEVASYVKKREKNISVTTEEEILFRKCMYETTGYKMKIVGKEDFLGYVGYVYENGLIFFERFYEDDATRVPAKTRATCVMDFETFLKKLTRKEFMDLVQSTDNPSICRLYHTPTWHLRVKKKIQSIAYTQESKMLIESLLEEVQYKKELK